MADMPAKTNNVLTLLSKVLNLAEAILSFQIAFGRGATPEGPTLTLR